MLGESSLFNHFDLNRKKWKPLFKQWNFSNLLTVFIRPRLLKCLWSRGKSDITTNWNLWHFSWNVKSVEIVVLAIDWEKLSQRTKTYFKFKLDEKQRLFALYRTVRAWSPAITKFKTPWLIKYLLYISG